MSELMEMLTRGINEGQTNHNVSMAGVLEQVSQKDNKTKRQTNHVHNGVLLRACHNNNNNMII